MSDRPEERLLVFASRHHGLFRLADALTAGLTERQVRYRVRTGRFERIGRGVYRVRGTPTDHTGAALEATLRRLGHPAVGR